MNDVVDADVQAMRDARGSAAELKTRFISLRSEIPEKLIFAFEGNDDRGVYFSWIRQINAEIGYEPFCCGGKSGVLKLHEVLKRDQNGLFAQVFFFVDRDFDDLRSTEPDDSIFLTCQYSVENYLVNRDVLDSILRLELHCHSAPTVRERIISHFEAIYDLFLDRTLQHNFDLYVIRKCGLELATELPKSINKLVDLRLDNVEPSELPIERVIVANPPINQTERERLSADFYSMDRRGRFRGKFALLFFKAWLTMLVAERKRDGSDYFSPLDAITKVSVEHLNHATLATRSNPPIRLKEFIDRIINVED